MRRSHLLGGWLGCMVAVLASAWACDPDTPTGPGAIMLAVNTDLAAPRDVASVGLFISSDGRPIFSATRDVAPTGEVTFPATIAIVADEKRPQAVIRIRVVAFGASGKVRVLRDALTTVPRRRTALLRLPLSWINEGSGSGSRFDAETTTEGILRLGSRCAAPEQTVIDGRCADARIDPAQLPDYVEAEVFGGGDATGAGGACFDVAACFAAPSVLTLDATCVGKLGGGQRADDPNLSLGVAVAQPAAGSEPTGECLGNGVCVVALDKGSTWTAEGDSVRLPPALCERIGRGEALGVVATTSCASKTIATPACGPASAVPSTNAVRPGGAPPPPRPLDFDSGGAADGAATTIDAGNDASSPSDAGADGGTPTIDGGPDAAVGDAGPDGSADGGPSDAGLDGGPSDAGADAGPIDAGADAGATAFGPVVDYMIGEPGATNLRFDGARLYLARANNGALEANILAFDFAPLLATPALPTARTIFFLPPDSVGTTAPIWDLAINAGQGVSLAGAFGLGTKYLGCTFGGAGCSQSGPFSATGMPAGATRALAASPHRVFVAADPTNPVLSTYTVASNTWSSFAIGGATAAITALHYVSGTSTLLVGFANGDIYRCSDTAGVPCTGSSGTFFSAAPPGGAVLAFTETAAMQMVWATAGIGIFRESTGTAQLIGNGASVGTTTTSLAVDATYVYAPFQNTLNAFAADGSNTSPVVVASEGAPVLSVVSTPEHVFYSAPPDLQPGPIKARCKRFVNPACN